MRKWKKRLVISLGMAMMFPALSGLGMTSKAADSVALNTNNFDQDFMKYLQKFDVSGNDGVLSESEISNIKSIDVSEIPYTQLKGLSYFKDSLESLNFNGNKSVGSLDLTGFSKLKNVTFSGAAIKSITFGTSTTIKSIKCSESGLTSLDVSGCSNLSSLDCNQSVKLATINLSNSLESVDVYGTSLSKIDTSGLSALKSLDIGFTGIQKIDLANNKALQKFYCNNATALNSLDLSNHTSLEKVSADFSSVGSMNLSGCANLTEVSVNNGNSSNKKGVLTSIDLTDDTKLSSLNLANNQISLLDLSTNTGLSALVINNNKDLTYSGTHTVNLTKNISLTSLECSDCDFTKLSLNNNSKLVTLICKNNSLKELTVSNLSELYKLDCSSNLLEELDVGNNSELGILYCDSNRLVHLDLSKNLKLNDFSCNSNVREVSLDNNYQYSLAGTDFQTAQATTKAHCGDQVTNGSINGYIVTPNVNTDEMTYSYVTGKDGTNVQFRLKFLNPLKVTVWFSGKAASFSRGGNNERPGISFVKGAENVQCELKLDDGTVLPNGSLVTWDATEIMDMNGQTGVVKFKEIGQGTITVNVGGKPRGYVLIQVIPPVEKIILDKTDIKLIKGGDYEKSVTNIAATVLPDNELVNKKVEWKSSDTKVASVSAYGDVRAIGAGTATITCSATDGSKVFATAKVSVTQVAQTVSLSYKTNAGKEERVYNLLNIVTGFKKQLIVTKSPVNAIDPQLKWTSSNPSVVKVEANGVVTAMGVGKATLTYEGTNGCAIKQTIEVNVTEGVKSISLANLSSNSGNVYMDDYESGIELKATVSPSNANNKTVTWTSSNREIADVYDGVVRMKKAGKVVITCTANDGSEVSASYVLNIKALVKQISLEKNIFLKGKSTKAKLIFFPEYASNKKVKYSSSNKKIATISSKGVIKAKKVGTCVITIKAKDGSGIVSKITINVVKPVKKITIKNEKNKTVKTLTVKKRQTARLHTVVSPIDAYTQSVTWKSSNEKIATVDASGVVKGKKKGTCKITCTAADGSKVKKTIKVKVK